MEDCIFCQIAEGKIATNVVFENDLVIAFEDVNPQAPVHTLVIPKAHYLNLQDEVPGLVLAAIFSAVREVASIKGVAESGYRVIVNNGPASNQSVGHLHVHVLGGREMSHHMLTFVGED